MKYFCDLDNLKVNIDDNNKIDNYSIDRVLRVFIDNKEFYSRMIDSSPEFKKEINFLKHLCDMGLESRTFEYNCFVFTSIIPFKLENADIYRVFKIPYLFRLKCNNTIPTLSLIETLYIRRSAEFKYEENKLFKYLSKRFKELDSDYVFIHPIEEVTSFTFDTLSNRGYPLIQFNNGKTFTGIPKSFR